MDNKRLLTYQINDGCIAINDDNTADSILVVNGECLACSLSKDVVIENATSLKLSIIAADKVSTRFSDRPKLKEGLRITEMFDSTVFFCDGEKAVLQDDVMYHTRRFKVQKLIDALEKVYQIPDSLPIYENSYCRARYLKDGNIVIINSQTDCLVFDLSSLNSKECTISNCLVNAQTHNNVRYVTSNNTMSLYTDDMRTLMEVAVDDPIRHYLKIDRKQCTA